jgi:4-hydroxybenzoate polyprenyltransferase
MTNMNQFDVRPGTGAAIRGMLTIVRPGRIAKALPFALLGAYLAGGHSARLALNLVSMLVVVSCIMAFGFIVNDCFDLPVDTLSKPGRPIPAGKLRLQWAIFLATLLVICAVLVSSSLGLAPSVFALVTIVLSYSYSRRFKNTVLWGNAVMALLVASIVMFGSLVAGTPTLADWTLCLLVFLNVLAFEVLHTASDREGDTLAGLTTTSTMLGVSSALRLFQLFIGLFIVIGIGAWIVGIASSAYLVSGIFCTILPLIGITLYVSRNPDNRALHLAERLMEIVWIVSLLPALLLRA